MVEKTIELTGMSSKSIEDAVQLAVSRAAVTIDSITRVNVKDVQADVEDGKVSRWRVKVGVSFPVLDRLHE